MVAKSKRAYRSLADFFEQTGMKQEEFAMKVGITPAYVSMLASGRRRPSLTLALRIVSIANIPLETLVPAQAVAS